MLLSSKCMLSILSKFDLSRNRYIKNVLLLEGNSIVPLLGCLESSGGVVFEDWRFRRVSIEIKLKPIVSKTTIRKTPNALGVEVSRFLFAARTMGRMIGFCCADDNCLQAHSGIAQPMIRDDFNCSQCHARVSRRFVVMHFHHYALLFGDSSFGVTQVIAAA